MDFYPNGGKKQPNCEKGDKKCDYLKVKILIDS